MNYFTLIFGILSLGVLLSNGYRLDNFENDVLRAKRSSQEPNNNPFGAVVKMGDTMMQAGVRGGQTMLSVGSEMVSTMADTAQSMPSMAGRKRRNAEFDAQLGNKIKRNVVDIDDSNNVRYKRQSEDEEDESAISEILQTINNFFAVFIAHASEFIANMKSKMQSNDE